MTNMGLSVSQPSQPPAGLSVAGTGGKLSFDRVDDERTGDKIQWQVYVHLPSGQKIPTHLSPETASRVSKYANQVLFSVHDFRSVEGVRRLHLASRVVELPTRDGGQRFISPADQRENSCLEENDRQRCAGLMDRIWGEFYRANPSLKDDRANPLAPLCRLPFVKSIGDFMGSKEVSQVCASVPLGAGESREDLVNRVWVMDQAIQNLVEEMKKGYHLQGEKMIAYFQQLRPRIALLEIVSAARAGTAEGASSVQKEIKNGDMKLLKEKLRLIEKKLGKKKDVSHKWMEAMLSGMCLQWFYDAVDSIEEGRSTASLIDRANDREAVGYEELLKDVALLHFCKSEREVEDEDGYGDSYQRVNREFDWEGSPSTEGEGPEADLSMAGRLRHHLRLAEERSAGREFDESRAGDANYLREWIFDRQSMRDHAKEVLGRLREKLNHLVWGDATEG